MRELKIAYGSKCYALKWVNKTITFDELCNRLKNTIRTSETMKEYTKLSSDEKQKIKDKGGFVGGCLKDGRRKNINVKYRSMLTMDADQADTGFIERYITSCPYASCLYTTHSHTAENPRVRIIVPLTRNVTSKEYIALSRYFADEWGIDMFVECSYRPQQLMYWPTTASDGEFICEKINGEWLDPDSVLSSHSEWEDVSKLPISSKERPIRKLSDKNQADPLEKSGVIGAFNRAYYPIETAIEELLSEVYARTTNDAERYNYIPGKGYAGVVVYENKFIYSHHATDPACGKLCSAFDAVRIHKFGDDETSFKNMINYALTLDKVQKQLSEDKKKEAEKDFAEQVSGEFVKPIPFSKYTMMRFPIESLPKEIRDYVEAVAESTQTPIDMAGTLALSVLSVCLQGKYCIQGKSDWIEPLNTYMLVIASPPERKSAVQRAMVKALNDYEMEYNKIHASNVETSRMKKRILERKQKSY